MPQDFDVDKFMVEQRKPAAGQPAPAKDFDVDAFMQEQRTQKPKSRPRAYTPPTERQQFGQRRLPEFGSRFTFNRPAQPREIEAPDSTTGPLAESLRQQERRGFERKPLLERTYERTYDALARGGGALLEAIPALTPGPPMTAVARTKTARAAAAPVRRFQEERGRELEQRRQSRPSSLATEVGEGIIEAAPTVAALGLTGAGAGGGMLTSALLGGGMAGASIPLEQLRQQPGRSALQIGVGAAAPIVGGRVGSAVGGAVAKRLASPVGQSAARVGGELLGGGAGNVIGTGAEQLAFEGRIDPRELARQGIIGAALSAPGAIGAARRIPATQPNVVAPGAVETGPPRTPGGAIIAGPSSLPSRRLLPPGSPNEVPTEQLAPRVQSTQRLPEPIYPDAPETTEMPAIRQRIAAENAPTTPAGGLRPAQQPSVRQTAELPRIEPTTAILPQSRRSPTERLPVPQATDENIGQLRARQEELGRLAYDRRGDFTGDLRDEYNQLTAHIRDYENQRALRELGEPPGQRPEAPPNPVEREARRAALQQKTGPMPETLTPGRKVTQETQIPRLRAAETFISREDARQGHFERFNDQELVDEIRRMEEIQNQATRGKSKLTPEQLEANRFDLKVAVEMQKERGRLQRQIGIEPANRIAPRTPARTFKKHPEAAPEGRQIQHSQFGAVTEAADQVGVRKGQLRVIDEAGKPHIIQNPRTAGNQNAAFVRSIPAGAMPELTAPNAPPSPLAGKAVKTGPRTSYAIPSEAMPELRGKQPNIVQRMAKLARTPSSPVSVTQLRAEFPNLNKADFDAAMAKLNNEGRIALHRHDHPASLSQAQRDSMVKIGNDYFTAATIREQVRGFGLGGFGKIKLPSRAEASETAGGVQAVSQLGNPRFVIRNILQHVAYGKQERTATRLAAAVDWAYSKATGKGRQIATPRGSDLASYVRNWGKAIDAYKKGQPLPGGSSAIAHTANANKLDKAVSKVMTWVNEIPDSANWQTRFEDSLQSITRKNAKIDPQDAIDQAMMEANKAALRDPNFVSAGLQMLKQGINKLSSPVFGTDKFGVGDFILKYAQTPGALFKRGLERSPLGLFQVAKEIATPGQFRRRNTLLALSRVAEGAATGVGLGAGLAAAGVLVGPEEEKKAGKAMEREEGVRGYSLNASALLRMMTGDFSGEMQDGDTLYSIDWLQPWAMNLSAGAALWGLHKNGKLGAGSGAKAAGEAVYNSLAKTLDVMGDQSVLKNLARYMDRASGETFGDQVYNFAKAVGLDVPSSFVPSLARQTRQVVDPYERDTRPEQRGSLGGFVEEAKNRALAQLPGVSESFPKRPSLLTGEDKKTALGEMSMPARIGAQFSPANVSTYTPRAVAREVSRLNRAGEQVSISFPAPKVDKKAGTRELTSDLRGRERRFAETFSRMSGEMIADAFYKDADDETKAAAWAGLKRHLANLGKEDFEEKSIDEIVEDAMEAVEKRREKEQ